MKKWIILIIIVLILGAATMYRIHILATTQPAESIDKVQQRDGIPVRVVVVRREDLKETIAISGSIRPFQQINIVPTITERIARIHVSTSQKVAKGDILVSLDDTKSKLALAAAGASEAQARQQLTLLQNGSRPEEIEAAKAMVEQARAAFERQEIELKRQRQLYKEEVTTLQRLEDIEAGYSSAKAALEAAQAQYKLIEKGPREEDIRIAEARLDLAETGLAQARKNLDDHYLNAPFDGVVSLKNLEPGAIAEMNQTVIFQLADCTRVYLDLNVSELYISKISVRMQVKVTVDALPGKDFTGTIAEINSIANTTDRSYVTRILIENEEGLLRPGMFARGHIVTKNIKQALVVPSDALHSVDGENWVFVVDETLTARRREITVDGLFDGVVVVIEGLSEGENIITLSQDVQPGDKVKL